MSKIAVEPPVRLDNKGRCCGKKPKLYKTDQGGGEKVLPFLWCPRCDVSFDPATGSQIENNHYCEYDGGFAYRRWLRGK